MTTHKDRLKNLVKKFQRTQKVTPETLQRILKTRQAAQQVGKEVRSEKGK